jgi:chemotaxis protein methyltransferase CheR
MSAAPMLRQTSGSDGAATAELLRVRDVIYQAAGIFHPDTKLHLLQDRCIRRMKELGVASLQEYTARLTSNADRQAELVALLNEIAIGETSFFRNQPQLDALQRIVIPNILRAKASLPLHRLRIWSAGCSTGEEPYTLRLLTLEEAGQLNGWGVEILATDLNDRSLVQAQQGIYSNYSTRNLNPALRNKYFTAQEDKYQANALTRSNVTFSRLNLTDDSRMTFMKSMDIIFCCNVLIYFDLASKRRVIQHFYNNLLPHGYLFLGHSESLYGVSDDFRLVHFPGTTAYVKGERKMPPGKTQ